MVKGFRFFLVSFVLVVGIFLSLDFVSADFASCWELSNSSSATCQANTNCVWKETTDPWCDVEWSPSGCCMEKSCWLYGETNFTWCEADTLNYNVSCNWDSGMITWYPNETQAPAGGCMTNWTDNTGGDSWGGVAEGCWQYDGNKASCSAQGGTCKWTANDQNQDPWCWITSLTSAQDKNSDATTNDIGCCETTGCWNNDNNEAACMTTFQQNCYYENNSYGGGWCMTKSCGEITTEANCTYAKQNLMMPCNWDVSGANCSDSAYGGGGFGYYEDSDSCFNAGGWYDFSGSCIMPNGTGVSEGSGGFMFAGDAHCWFGDNQPLVCNNVTGCAYCVAGTGNFGVDDINSSNICYNKPIGYCEGHDTGDSGSYDNANNTANLACTDILIKSACKYGPLPNCKWTNSSVSVDIGGNGYCVVGASSEKKSAPPAQYCEDPVARDNFTVCTQMIEEYMMPCVWQNTTYPVTNCTFNSGAVFGSGGEKDFDTISSQFACTSAGGTWNTEYYVDGNVLKQDSWCEMTGIFDIDLGQGVSNKMNCHTSCWSCEFQSNGTAWANVADIEAACVGSNLGYCNWKNDSSSFNGFGWCDYPNEMEFGGAKDCDLECEGCNFMNSPQVACGASMANNGTGCKWVSEGDNNYCVDKAKKVCGTDCFSCYEVSSCQGSGLNCSWDTTFNLCNPDGFTGEVCFDGIDNDADTLIDCADPDCGFDNFCGGSTFGGDCFAQTGLSGCESTEAFNGLNCVWLTDSWNQDGWCDMPGSNCWKFDNNLTGCGLTSGCTNDSSSMASNTFCDINVTSMDAAASWVGNQGCWNVPDEVNCSTFDACQWVNDTWCASNPSDSWCVSNPNAGWCDYKPFSICMNLSDASTCNSNNNCSWQEDSYSMYGGWCSVGCMNWSISTSGECTSASTGDPGLCEWRESANTCQPEIFMFMGSGGGGGKTGCWAYDGNQTKCVLNNVTCTYVNDSYSNNNVSVNEPAGWCMDNSEYEHFGDMQGDVIELASDSGNILGLNETGVDKEVDLIGMGMRVTDEGFNFGAGIYNISETMMCNGYMIGSPMNFSAIKVQGAGNKTTQFFWYLDTNGNSSDGCVAIPSSGANLTGYDFLVSYISRNTTSNGIVETKQLMRCSNGIWSPTNALVTTSKKLSCGEIGGVMIAIAKQDIEAFAEYNKTVVMKIFMSSANDSDTRVSPSDSVGPGYYTPGTIDFGFTDCSDPTMSKNSKCKNFQKFGFNVFEECKNGFDDDENGLIDCADPFCAFTPDCASGTAFNFVLDSNDITSPVVVFSDIEKLNDAAFIRIDTSEPSNLSLSFYKNDSNCKSLNKTINDVGIETYQQNANFKPFHSLDLMSDTLGYNLINNTAYYYKIKVCDPSNNCAISACSNFTTKTTNVAKSFIFKMDLPDGYTVDIPALGKVGYNFTETFGGAVYEVGIKTNTSVTKNMNMTIRCNNWTNMSIGFFGMNVLSPINIDLTNAFLCDTSSGMMGMNSSLKKWNKLINELHLGGATDYIEITMPTPYSSSNTFNWVNDAGADATDVGNYVSCGGTTTTVCKIPVSLGL